ncbi:MAG: GIY-YIG nuclease family protein, partial [Saprospiraceae bacterium]
NLFDLKHVTLPDERASADFVAKRKSCKDFDRYEASFKAVQHDLASGKRKLLAFKEQNLWAGDYYVHNGILLYLEQVDFKEDIQPYKSGSRLRKDGRTRVIFENGTESNMLYRSLYKGLLANGKAVSENVDKANEIFYERFGSITEKDQDTGYIYVLKSKSTNPDITSIRHLYKIGYSTTKVEERIKNAPQEPTYLMAEVSIIIVYNCYNMNPQKLEQLMHNFFGKWCLNLDVFDQAGQRHTPREWFIAPLYIIEQAIQLIISGEIVKYRYDGDIEEIVMR